MWADGRQREAARRLLALAAKAGWSAADLDPRADPAPDLDAFARELGLDLEEVPGAREFVSGAARLAVELGAGHLVLSRGGRDGVFRGQPAYVEAVNHVLREKEQP